MPPRGVAERSTAAAVSLTLLWSAGCGPEDVLGPVDGPEVRSVTLAPNPWNVLSAVVEAEVQGADSAAVLIEPEEAALDGVSAAVVPTGGSARIPVLGLRPETPYELRVVAFGHSASVVSDPLTLTTGSLPADLPSYTTSGSDPSPGYVAFSAGRYGVVIDNSGRVVWYRAFPFGPGLNFQPQPNGRYVARPPPPDPVTPASWLEVDVLGDVTRAFGCSRDLQPRFHDLIAAPDGDVWIMCDETRVMDLTAHGGVAAARVTGTVVQHLDASGAILFEWSPFDRLSITDLDPEERVGESVNWTHGNAIDLDTDGNPIVSFRSLSEITKIDRTTGAVLWRLGGPRSDFTFVDGPTPPFARQHGVRVTGPGRLLLLDNSGDPAQSRAERYLFDAEIGAARLVASYGPDPGVIAQLGGTTQDLPGGRALVAFGDGGRVQEYDADGRVLWQIEGDAGYIFRAHRIESLYRPAVSPGH